MSTPTIYRWTDASAPVLTGTAGDLVNLLTKCLCTGYGSQSAAGWTLKSGFAGNSSTRAVYQQGGGNAFYLDVNDAGASGVLTGATGKEAAVRGYEAMTDVSTGTNPFPTTAQIAAATSNWRKSASADTVPRGWVIFADDRTFMLGVLDGDTINPYTYKVYYFGDFYSIKSADGFRTLISTRTVVNNTAVTGSLGVAYNTNFSISVSIAGIFTARNASGSGTSTGGQLITTGSALETTTAFPALDGNIYVSRILTGDTSATTGVRGWLRGIYSLMYPAGLNDGDTFTGTGDFSGRSFIVLKGINTTVNSGFVIETTAWDTSS